MRWKAYACRYPKEAGGNKRVTFAIYPLRMTKTIVLGVAVGLTCVLGAPAALAHHSYGAFETDREIQIDGVVERFEWVAPHSIITVKTADKTYRGEWQAPVSLARFGMTRDVLRAGDRVIVSGNPRRDIAETGIINVRAVTRLFDGWTWTGRSGEPRTATPPPPRP